MHPAGCSRVAAPYLAASTSSHSSAEYIHMLLLTPWSAIASSCCRWTPTGACGTSTTRDCTGLHEFLEGKTATHDFESLSCIGSNYAASFDGALGNVSLTSSGAAVAAVPTPLKVTHASDCSATLHLQLDTVVLGNLTVGGLDGRRAGGARCHS